MVIVLRAACQSHVDQSGLMADAELVTEGEVRDL